MTAATDAHKDHELSLVSASSLSYMACDTCKVVVEAYNEGWPDGIIPWIPAGVRYIPSSPAPVDTRSQFGDQVDIKVAE